MTHTAWLGPWDVAEPERILDELQEHGLAGVRLAVAYHAARLLLPRPCPRVVDLAGSAVYFASSPARYGRLRPTVAGDVLPFLEAASRRHFPVRAWIVLCHNDSFGQEHPDCCITNAWGDVYSYALCPAQPDVREYARALCGEVAQLPIAGIDLEAASFFGYEHQSAHDKRGIAAVPRALSVCCCAACSQWRPWVRSHGQNDPALPAEYMAYRRAMLCRLMVEIRAAAPGLPIDLRWTPDPLHFGGKSQLAPEDLPGRAEAVTLTYFGQPVTPAPDLPVPRRLGAVFHWPDCPDAGALRTRYAQLCQPGVEEIAFYLWGLAPATQLAALKEILTCP